MLRDSLTGQLEPILLNLRPKNARRRNQDCNLQ